MTERRSKVALVGCGARGRSHLDVILALADRLELVAICDRNAGTVAQVLSLAGPGVHGSADLDELLRRARPDFAVVSLKSDIQPYACRRLLEAGVPVLAEVPLAFTGPAALPALEAARRRGIPFGAAENYVCTPLEQLKQRAIGAGIFGAVTGAEVSGSVNHKGHEIAVARSYLGFDHAPVRIRARSDGRGLRTLEAVPIPSVMSGAVEFDSGARLEALFSGWGTKGPTMPIVGWRSEFSGTRGGYHERRFHRGRDPFAGWEPIELERRVHDVAGVTTLVELALGNDPRVVWRNPFADRAFPADHRFQSMSDIEDLPQAWEVGLAHLLVDMAEAVAQGRPPAYPAERAMVDTRLRLAMLESASRGGDWLPWQDEPWPIEQRIARWSPFREIRKLRRRFRASSRARRG
jgi:predicted dehydrogenase